MGKRTPLPVFENVEILDAGSEGKAVARIDNYVVFVPFVVPGDIIDIRVVKRKKRYLEGKAIKLHKASPLRIEARCEHFGLCGGCKWQNLEYSDQLKFKQKQVVDNFERIGKLEIPEILPIKGSEKQYYYRNKLEFTFSNRRWLNDEELAREEAVEMNGLGFHLPGMFDRIIDVKNCYLQEEPSNSIRNELNRFAREQDYSFYDNRNHSGFLRNVIIRNSTLGDLMVIMIFGKDNPSEIEKVLHFLNEKFPEITSLNYVINTKQNDSINDLEVILFSGKKYIVEKMEDLEFRVGPLSFYQTNSEQAYELYKTARDFADLKGHEIVYDLYCGTGTIANFIAKKVRHVVGIEYVDSAISDASENSAINGHKNTSFFAGDMAKVLAPQFFEKNGMPDVVITDPPRAGMHPKVIDQLLSAAPEKIVYVSCNPATQARDIALLAEKYTLMKIQPVDMFPQTHHVENVSLLIRKNPEISEPAEQVLQ
ncbi:MAG: 23S rRNA (uracil(1939)-C(5))-methyltransferase RlmD [Bacteroidales bacterium]|nr:23S rRNA (uracil(1939)-C(5))-methyltransferase RlmD [Bacteroidales bacterium]